MGIDQKENCNIVIISIFEINRADVNLFSDINLNGSNAEKISGIIQNMNLIH